ncbi:MAG: signal recognition particle-docking protein FtsY [Polyangiales bacterium]
MSVEIIIAIAVAVFVAAAIAIARTRKPTLPGPPPAAETATPGPSGPETGAPTGAAPAAKSSAAEAPASPEAALRSGLQRTRGGFVQRLSELFGRSARLDPAIADEMEEVLLTADLGVHATDRMLGALRDGLARGASHDEAWNTLTDEAVSILRTGASPLRLDGKPAFMLVVGVNGVGKTTTIGKLASRYKSEGKQVLLAAGDTFRAAAVEQLAVWGRRNGCEVVRGAEGADPSSVIFDAIKKAQADGVDLVIADTAGRLHTKTPLMEELKKVGRSIEKALGRPPDEVLLVLDATNGQNAIQQAKLFKEAIAVTGIALTKLDGTAKGGVILGIVDQHKIPVRFVGVGEKVEDLRSFEPEAFARALFERPAVTDTSTAAEH